MKTTKETKITLLSWTQNPLETIYSQWFQSRKRGAVPIPQDLADAVAGEQFEEELRTGISISPPAPGPIEADILKVFNEVVEMDMPLGQTLYFTFLVENMPIALREQWVRHKIGHKFGDQLGVDTIPDGVDSTFWSQTMRTMVMDRFAADGDYVTPDWLEEHGDEPMHGFIKSLPGLGCPICFGKGQAPTTVVQGTNMDGKFEGKCSNGHVFHQEDFPCKSVSEFYHEQMGWIQSAYNRLIKAGMPVEDARNLLPMGMQHSMSVTMNFATIKSLMSKRGCWISQLGMWRPVIEGIARELSTKVHPAFDRLIQPPCIGKDDRFNECPFVAENKHLVNATDLPPCSLWLNNQVSAGTLADVGFNPMYAVNKDVTPEYWAVGTGRWDRYNQRQAHYASLWRRDPRTGERTKLA